MLLVHFLGVAIYCLKGQKPNSKLSYYASFYVYPYFHQNWNLFVPPPTKNYRLIAYNTNIKKDVFIELLTNHKANRLAGYEPLLIALSNSIYYFEIGTNLKNGKVIDDKNFEIISHFISNYLYRENHLKIILVVVDVNTKKERLYYN